MTPINEKLKIPATTIPTRTDWIFAFFLMPFIKAPTIPIDMAIKSVNCSIPFISLVIICSFIFEFVCHQSCDFCLSGEIIIFNRGTLRDNHWNVIDSVGMIMGIVVRNEKLIFTQQIQLQKRLCDTFICWFSDNLI